MNLKMIFVRNVQKMSTFVSEFEAYPGDLMNPE